MIVYKSGDFVLNRLINDYIVKNKEYVCSDESFDTDTLDEKFEKMKRFVIQKKEIETENTQDYFITTKDGEKYILATEIVFDKNGEKTVQKGTFLKYALVQPFTKDAVFIDEKDEFVDISGRGLNDIKCQRLACLGDFKQLYKHNPNIIISILDYICNKSWNEDGDIYSVLENVIPTKVNFDKELFLNIVNQNPEQCGEYIKNRYALYKFLFVEFNLKAKFDF